jgi:serine/threonine protein kinase
MRDPQKVPPVNKVQANEKKIRREIAILRRLKHPNIVSLIEVLDDPTKKRVHIGDARSTIGRLRTDNHNFSYGISWWRRVAMAHKKSQACSNSPSVYQDRSRCHAWTTLLCVAPPDLLFYKLMKLSAYSRHCTP